MPVLRDVPHIPLTHFRRIDMRFGKVDRLALDGNLSGGGLADTGERFQEFRLAVARDPGNADDLAGADIEGHVLDDLNATAVGHGQVRDIQDRSLRFGRFLVDLQQHTAADHEFGQFRHGGLRGLAGRHHLAAAHDGDRIGDGHDFAQLVRDQKDRLALVLEHLQDPEQVIGFSRRQDPGRLVENEDFSSAEQGLQDFHALLQTDRKIFDQRIHPDLEAVIVFQPFQFLARPGYPTGQQRSAFRAQDHVFQNGG